MTNALQLTVHPNALLDDALLRTEVERVAGTVPIDARIEIVRRAIDARHRRVRVHLTVRIHDASWMAETVHATELPALTGNVQVAIVGMGPAGLFCAWQLAQLGIRSCILERGKDVRARRRDLAALTREGRLHPDSNYCYGEGGAGTFSDGKLYTRSGKRGSIDAVLRAFVGYGATPDILVDARPHIGTNRLPAVISAMRAHLEHAGVNTLFQTHVNDIAIRGAQPTVVDATGSIISVRAVVMATGHSASEVWHMLANRGAQIEAKPFAMGVRIEHPQTFIDRMQWGPLHDHRALGSAWYRLVEPTSCGSVFSFCMCPGGFIAPACTEPNGQVVNGWSPSSRNGRYANSGLVAEVNPAVLQAWGHAPNDLWAGVNAQRALEQRAYALGGGGFVAPAQTLADFMHERTSTALPTCSYPRGLHAAPLHELLGPLTQPLREALTRLARKLPGFVGEDAVAVGVESRTSSPLRVARDAQTGAIMGLPSVFACGEGAGFAGGIVSAAMDGIQTARNVAASLGVHALSPSVT